MQDADFRAQIALHLKTLRKAQNISLDAASKLTGVSKAMLGQIERQESSPTISVLWKISSGLGTSFSAFFAGDPKLHVSDRAFPADTHMKVNTLFAYQDDAKMEMFEITLTHFHQQMSSPHAVGVIEHIVVKQGEMQVFFDQNWHRLKAGERVRFFSDQQHGYQALSECAVFDNIICYPSN